MYECYAGVDDGYFERGWRYTVLALAVHCLRKGVLVPAGIRFGLVRVDGADATYRIAVLARGLTVDLLLLDTAVYAGFNIADPQYLSSELGVPVVSVYHYPPDTDAVRKALEKAFPGEAWRLRILEAEWARLKRIDCPKGTLYAAVYGAGFSDAASKLCMLQLFTRTPEPLYTAGVAASLAARLRAGKLKRP